MSRLRVAILGAFVFPAPRGSQAFAREQAEALVRAGVDVEVVSYGMSSDDDTNPRGLSFATRSIGPPLRPRSARSGLHAAKPFADMALALRLRRLHRKRPFDVVLAHNAEAALVAKLARRLGGPPVVYVAHTLFEEELSAYVPGIDQDRLARIGRRIDRAAARAGLGTLALSDAAASRLAAHAETPVEVQPPGVALRQPTTNAELDRVCTAHALIPGEYLLYTGNLDVYQELPVLDRIAAELPELPVVVATHEAPPKRLEYTRMHAVHPDEVRPLLQGARLFLTPRKRSGGFPIKLANAMEAGCPILAREGQAVTLGHEHNAFLVAPDASPDDFVVAARKLLDQPAFGRALGMQARNTAQLYHDWDVIAQKTLRFVDTLLTRGR
jgi:glycosyltransferase involved in cell wall biosynthesis